MLDGYQYTDRSEVGQVTPDRASIDGKLLGQGRARKGDVFKSFPMGVHPPPEDFNRKLALIYGPTLAVKSVSQYSDIAPVTLYDFGDRPPWTLP
jgi:hypothetical protein